MNTSLDNATAFANFCIEEKLKPSDVKQLILLVRKVRNAETRKVCNDDPRVWEKSRVDADNARTEVDNLMKKYKIAVEWNSVVPTLFRSNKRINPGFSLFF